MLLSFFIIILVLGFLFLGFYFYRDRKYLKRPAREGLSPELKKEIETEREDFKRRKERFEKALSRAQTKSRTPLLRKGR
ncbi:MAG: hypothetical protein HYU99_09350 [Deltaproteobacteria bacterium]|nr:hypothetical protein [Deltaproteobacteria bacterium]